MKAYVSGWFELPLKYFDGEKTLAAYKRELTVTPRSFEGREPQTIRQYKIRHGRLCVPIEWGIAKFPRATLIDRTALAKRMHYPRKPSPDHPNAPKGQAEFMAQVENAVRDNFAALATASTGKGKTVVALWLAATLGVRVLVVVPTTEIMEGWIRETKEHLGLDAGTVRQGKCEWRGRNVVVALIHSLAKRDYGAEFYNAFGLVVWDEVHVVGAFTFSRTLGLFPSQYKLGLTATARRKDGAESLFLNYFGEGYAKQHEKALPCDCFTVRYRHQADRRWPKQLAIVLNILAATKHRNEFLVRWLMWLWTRNRQILGLSDRIEQLETVRDMLVAKGVPRESIGIVAKQRTYRYEDAYKPTKKVMQGHRYWYLARRWVEVRVTMKLPRGAHVSLCDDDTQPELLVHHKDLHVRFKKPVRVAVTKEEIAEAKTKQIILATYGMFSMGANVPRLDAGIDLTPRATGEQQIGRVRRYLPGKPKALWITPVDTGIPLLEAFADARIREYKNCNVTVIPYANKNQKAAAD